MYNMRLFITRRHFQQVTTRNISHIMTKKEHTYTDMLNKHYLIILIFGKEPDEFEELD
jgi:hypothetical protein